MRHKWKWQGGTTRATCTVCGVKTKTVQGPKGGAHSLYELPDGGKTNDAPKCENKWKR